MSIGQIILGVLMFAAVTALLYVWGLRRSLDQRADLERGLMNACGSKVVRYLKKNGSITLAQTAAVIEGVKVGPLWSRNRLQVADGRKAARHVIDFLLDQQYIEPDGKETYRLKP